jgi:LCP family protein required for cell wall assembly
MAGMLSIPRDLWVDIPGFEPNRINVVDYQGERAFGRGGGPQLVAETIEANLGIPIHAYVRVNFAGLERIIDALGGITVTSDRAFEEWLDDGAKGLWHLQVAEGSQHMDGRTALGYARYRSTTSDLDRTRRQQQILLAIRDAVLRPSVLPLVPRLLVSLADAVETDLSPGQVLSLVRLATQLDPAAYRTCVFDSTMYSDWITPGGAMVLVPNHARIAQAWAELTAVP